MKKLILIVFVLSFLGVSFATVGWPILIDNTYYDWDSNAIRYSQTFYDGLWGSKVYQYLIDTKEKKMITELDNLEFEENRLMSDLDQLKNYFIKKWFTPLQEFKLNKLPIQISLTLDHFNQVDESYEWNQVKPFDYIDDDENYMMSWYVSNYWRVNRIYLNNKMVSELPVSTCRLDPVNFRWMWLADLDAAIIIATSAREDCAEWWYIGERVHIIAPVKVDSKYFLAENSQMVDPYAYEENQTFTPSVWWLRIQPQMEGDNMVQGIGEIENNWVTENASFWEKIKNFLTEILARLGL